MNRNGIFTSLLEAHKKLSCGTENSGNVLRGKNILRGMYKFARLLRYSKPSNVDTTKILTDECYQNHCEAFRATVDRENNR